MRKISLLVCLLTSILVQATEIETKIYNILTPNKGDDNYIIMAGNGFVYNIDRDDKELVNLAYEAMEDSSFITLQLNAFSGIKHLINKRSEVNTIELINKEVSDSASFSMGISTSGDPDPLDNYSVSELADMSYAKRYFRSMKTKTRNRSECYNRAHIWSYELNTDYNIRSGKMWLFFSAKYIRDYDYKWWFHVAPYVEVATEREPIILDREFSRQPQKLTDWKNVYMKNNAECLQTADYTTYEDNTWNEHCFLIKSSMYYWQPLNLEALAKEGEAKFGFENYELGRAYRNGFRRSERRDI